MTKGGDLERLSRGRGRVRSLARSVEGRSSMIWFDGNTHRRIFFEWQDVIISSYIDFIVDF